MNNTKQTQDDRTIQPFNCSTIQRVKAYAFTLAETLIVIGIIGVVAALTLPNLNHATGDKETVTRVKKIYSSLTDAFDRAQAVYGDFDTWFTDTNCSRNNLAACNERFAKRITEFMKVSKDCGFNEGCWANAPLYFFGSDDYTDGNEHFENYLETLQSANTYMLTLSDGTSLGFACAAMTNKECNDYKIRVDINGPNKGKNTIGVDYFDFDILYRNQIDGNITKENQLCPSSCYHSASIGGSLGRVYNASNYSTLWIIRNDNLDYLKCHDELNWETKTSCE